jgi:hypothetical protein
LIADIKEAIELLGAIAVGFAARWAFKTQLPDKDEDHIVTILWALVLSVVLNTLFIAYGKLLTKDHLLAVRIHTPKDPKHLAELLGTVALAANVFWGILIGYIFGRIQVARTAASLARRAEEIKGVKEYLGHFFAVLCSTQHAHRAASDYFLNTVAKDKWLLVRTEKAAYRGYAHAHDSSDTEAYHLILHDPSQWDSETKKWSKKGWRSLLIQKDEIKIIAVTASADQIISKKRRRWLLRIGRIALVKLPLVSEQSPTPEPPPTNVQTDL